MKRTKKFCSLHKNLYYKKFAQGNFVFSNNPLNINLTIPKHFNQEVKKKKKTKDLQRFNY